MAEKATLDTEYALEAAVAEGHAEEGVHGGIHVAISAERLGDFAGIPLTNTLVTSWIAVLILLAVALVAGRRIALVPGKFQTLLEMLFGGIHDYVAETLESKTMARRFFPLLMTIFLFISIANILEFLPGVGSIVFTNSHGEIVPLLRGANTDLNTPLTLALISFFVIEVTGIAALGFWKYGKKFVVNPLRDFVGFFVGIIELIGELVRVISLSFRLFGNILAGAIIISVATYFAPYFGPVPLMMFEIFIGFLQAAIFALLTLFFIKLAVTDHSAEHAAH